MQCYWEMPPVTPGIPAPLHSGAHFSDRQEKCSDMPKTAKKSATKKTPSGPKPAAQDPAPTAPPSAVTKSMLAKLGRAYKKAGMTDVSEEKKLQFAQELLGAGIPLANRSSARIARVLKGENSIEALKEPRRAKE
jgi:hypothetical protein